VYYFIERVSVFLDESNEVQFPLIAGMAYDEVVNGK
jgi:hypothetical protein